MDFGQSVVLERDRDGDPDGDQEPGVVVNQAAASGHTDKLIRAIQVDPSVLEQQDADGLTPLGHSVMGKQLGALKKLVKMGSNVNAQDNLGRTGLAIAAYHGWYEGVVYLLRHGAKFSLCDKSGRSPLHASSYDTDYRTMCALLQNLCRSEINQRDHEGMTALHWGAFHNRPNHVRILLERGADIFREDIDGKTALHWAAQNGNLECCELLYKWKDGKLLLNYGDHAGKTPVHFAAAAGNVSVIKSFATVEDCDLEAEDPDDRTPLHWAVATGQTKCVSLLLNLCVSPNAVDAEGCTPLDYARQSNHKECQTLLEEKLGVQSCPDVGQPQSRDRPPHTNQDNSPTNSSTKSPFNFIKGLFGINNKKGLSYSNSLSEISSSDMLSVDMALMKQELRDSSAEWLDPKTDEGEGETTGPANQLISDESSDRLLSDQVDDLKFHSIEGDLKVVSNQLNSDDSHRETALRPLSPSVHTKESLDSDPPIEVREDATVLVNSENSAGEGKKSKLSAVSSPVHLAQVPNKKGTSHQPMNSAVTTDLLGSPTASRTPALSPRAGTDTNELAPLKGPKPPTGMTIHEKVLALRMDRTGASRSPTPPSWLHRSSDPLSLRRDPGRSPLVGDEIGGLSILSPRDSHKKAAKLGHKLSSDNRLRSPIPATGLDRPPAFARHSPIPGSNGMQLSPPRIIGQSATIQKRTPPGNQSPVSGTFSMAERKELDKQLHNLLL